jgi:hypothetical protein
MKLLSQIILLSFFTFSLQILCAQKPATRTAASIVQKSKLPVLTTHLGPTKDSVVSLNANLVKSIIDARLVITDEKGNEYKLTYYEFLYKRIGIKEDEATGKISPTTTISADHFATSPLPVLWKKIIKEELKPGEELYFFDIIVKNVQGASMYAPSLKILIQ